MMDDARRRAFDEALRHWPEVFAFARQLAAAPARAEDLAQEAYLRLWALDRPPDEARPVRALLFTIVKNLVRSEARKRGARALDFALDEPEVALEAGQGGPIDLASLTEEREQVRAALDRLRPAWRAALFLRDGLSCSYAEVARCLDTSEDVVRTTLHRARRRLREMLRGTVTEGRKP